MQGKENLENKIQAAKKYFNTQIETKYFFDILFEMNRYFDKQFVVSLHSQFNKKINQNERNLLRKYYYYGIKNYLYLINVDYFPQYAATEADKSQVLNAFIERCKNYDSSKIVNSIIERYSLVKENKIADNSKKWLSWFEQKRKTTSDFSLFIYDYEQADFEQSNYNISNIFKVIADIYDHLENYRHFIFKLHGKLFNNEHEDVTWQVLYKIGIYCENFIQYRKPFLPFKKQKSIDKLTSFLDERFLENDNNTLAQDFFSSISTGFKFEDCFVSDNQDDIILIMKKIKLDTSAIPCPACMTTIQNGNSFPELFLRSYECKNPACPERSKSGRGKRFDEFGTYRYFKLVENDSQNQIDNDLYSKWRRDIFSHNADIYEMLIRYYAWSGESICCSKNCSIKNAHNRKIIIYHSFETTQYNTNFEELPIVELFSKLSFLCKNTRGTKKLQKNIEILNENSTENLRLLKAGQIGSAITSPPYYNAREYSKWQNMILYFVDMLINAKGVYQILCNDGYYLYNIGDIVASDNIYVESNMSKKRLMLGFYSCLIFEKAGFNLCGNIIWDKGEVQSKRNSTMNRNSGYVKCINCYEHIFVFRKGKESKIVSSVQHITPVIKINAISIQLRIQWNLLTL